MRAIAITEEESAALASRLVAAVRQGASDVQPHWDAVAAYRELLKNTQPRADKPWETACELFVPYVKQAKTALLSHFVPTLLGPDPIFHVEGHDPQSKDASDHLERFLQQQLTQQVEFRRVCERWFDASLRDGTGILHLGWETRQTRRPVYVRVLEAEIDVETGDVIASEGDMRAERRLVTVYDAPRADLVPLDHFGTFPVANADIQESPGVFMRAAVTGETILQRMHAGEFDREAVATLRNHAGDTETAQSDDSKLRALGDPSADEDFRARTYTLTQIYYRYAAEDSTEPAEDWLFTIHETSGIVLQAMPSPWFHQQRPFVAISPYQDVSGYLGDCLAGAGAGHVQEGQTTLLRLAIDASAIGISPELLVAKSIGQEHMADLQKRRGPGRVIPFPDAYFEQNSTKFQPFANNGYQPTMVVPMIEQLDRIGQMSTGVNDTMKGIPNPGNVTATEAQQIMESSQKTLALLTDRIAAGLTQAGRILYGLNYQFQGNDGPQALWAELHPPSLNLRGTSPLPSQEFLGTSPQEMGAMGPQEEEPALTLFDVLSGNYTITSSGVRDTNNRAILAKRAQETLQLVMTLRQDPLLGGVIGPKQLYAVCSDALQANGTTNPERYLGTEDEWTAGAQGMQAQGAPGLLPSGTQPGMVPNGPQMAAGGPQAGNMPSGGDMPYPPQAVMELAQGLGIAPNDLLAVAAQLGFPPLPALIEALQQGVNGGAA